MDRFCDMRCLIVAALLGAAFSVGLAQMPTGDTIQIQTSSGVVKNFYKSAAYVGDNFVFFDTFGDKDFHIQYDRSNGTFVIQLIVFTRDKAQKVREAAQSEFLKRLGIDETTACRLNVTLLAPRQFPMLVRDVHDYGLSFCPGSEPLPGQPISSRVARNRRRTQQTATEAPGALPASQECAGLPKPLELLRGEKKDGFHFTSGRRLLYAGKPFSGFKFRRSVERIAVLRHSPVSGDKYAICVTFDDLESPPCQ